MTPTLADPFQGKPVLAAMRPAHSRHAPTSATSDAEQQILDLLDRVDATPDHPSAARLLAEAMRAGQCTPALASLSRVDPSAALAAADTLLTLLR